MAYSRLLSDLKLSVTRRWQLESSPDLSGAAGTPGGDTLREMINDAIVEVYDLVVQKWTDYFTKSNVFVTTAGQDIYTTSFITGGTDDFYKLRKLELQQGTRYRRLLPHDLDASHHFVAQGPGDRRYRYRLQGGTLVLVPAPTQIETMRLYYIPLPTQLVADADSITFPVPIAQKLLLAVVGRDVLDRQELDPSPALAAVDRLTKKLGVAADGLDAAEPFYIDADGPPPEFEEDIFY